MYEKEKIHLQYLYVFIGKKKTLHINWPMQFNPVLFMGQLYFKKHFEIARDMCNFTGAWDLYSVMNFLYSAYKRIETHGKQFYKNCTRNLKKKKS